MGESVAETAITNWLKEVGDKLEAGWSGTWIATDKGRQWGAECEVSGILVEQLFSEWFSSSGSNHSYYETKEERWFQSVVKAAAASEAVAEVTKPLMPLKIALQHRLIFWFY
jgi:hypothetical protein